MKPLCFVIMPFGKKKDSDGKTIDFDLIYKKLLLPAIDAAGMESVRADEETVNGIIHKPMYERLILCDYAVADLTTANANVFYELGIRHAVKPYTTVTIFAAGSNLPFDLNSVRCLPYFYDKKKKSVKKKDAEAIAKQLERAKKQKTTDSPVYQLVDGISFQNSVAHQKTDVFRDQVEYNKKIKDQLEKLRGQGGKPDEKIKAVDEFIKKKKINVDDEETGVLIDVMLTYRSIGSEEALKKMVEFIESLPPHIKNTVMVQEQLGFALNRIGEKDKAIKILESVVTQNGPSSETYGIMGRVYKDKYDQAVKEGNAPRAAGFLNQAIETYRKGFEADWRDAYPGINLLTLLEIRGDKEEIKRLSPVVEFSVKRKIASKTPDYWDYATLLEIAVIADDDPMAQENLGEALARPIEGDWMTNTTIKNLTLIADVRKRRSESSVLAEKMIEALREPIKP